MKMLLVEWQDAESRSGWGNRKTIVADLLGQNTHRCVGFELHNDKRGIVLAMGVEQNNDLVMDTLFIPRPYIKAVSELRKK